MRLAFYMYVLVFVVALPARLADLYSGWLLPLSCMTLVEVRDC